MILKVLSNRNDSMILWKWKEKKLLEEEMEEGSSKTKLKLPHSLSLCFRKVSDVDLS